MPKDDGFCGRPHHAEALRRVLNKGVKPMRLFKVTVLSDGPPPEFGLTYDAIVLAADENEAKQVAWNNPADDIKVEEIQTDKPILVQGSYR